MNEFHLVLKKTAEFDAWYRSLQTTTRTIVDARLDRLAAGHLGASRSLGDGLFELKWKNGMRVYYSRKRVAGIDAIVLWGGFKGTQRADITKARGPKGRYEEEINEGA